MPRLVKKLLPALAVGIATCAFAVSSASAGDVSGSAALNTLTATATNTTPPEDVGRSIELTVSGQVLATSTKKVAKRCRGSRTFFADWVSVTGQKRGVYGVHLSSKAGRFKGDFPLEYGGPDPDDPSRVLNGDVPFAGGVLTLIVSVGKAQVKGNRGRPFTCRRLSTTLQVPFPPANVYY